MTKPSRPVSNGREDAAGSSRRRDRAPRFAKPVTTSGVFTDSVPPAITTSHWPEHSRSRATAMAVAPDAHAVDAARVGPWAFRASATSPADRLDSSIGTSEGDTASGPSRSSRWCCASPAPMPPKLHPTTTPTRAASQAAQSRPASATASVAASSANWVGLLRRNAFRRPSIPVSMSSMAQQKSTGRPSRSACDAAVVASPLQTRCQVASAPTPAGVSRPRPVTTTSGALTADCLPRPPGSPRPEPRLRSGWSCGAGPRPAG